MPSPCEHSALGWRMTQREQMQRETTADQWGLTFHSADTVPQVPSHLLGKGI